MLGRFGFGGTRCFVGEITRSMSWMGPAWRENAIPKDRRSEQQPWPTQAILTYPTYETMSSFPLVSINKRMSRWPCRTIFLLTC